MRTKEKKLNLSSLSGYTLLEILLVLMILAGIGFSLLLQIPHDLQRKSLELSSTRLLEDLREAQQAAISSNVWYKVQYFPHTGQYMIFMQGEFIRTVNLEQGVRYVNNPPPLVFLPTGAPDAGMTIVLAAGSQERKVIIAPVMGRIRLE